jgi:hypothetical protein
MDGVDSVKKPTTTQGRAFWAGDASSGELETHLLRTHGMRLIRRRSLESVRPRDEGSRCDSLELEGIDVSAQARVQHGHMKQTAYEFALSLVYHVGLKSPLTLECSVYHALHRY